MNKKVILVSPPAKSNRTPEENLGLEYLASESIKNGHDVRYLDAWVCDYSVDYVVGTILKKQYDVVGISLSMDSFSQVKEIVEALNKKNYPGQVVLGGVFASFQAEDILNEIGSKICGIFLGEADYSFQHFLREGDIKKILGTIYKDKQGNIKTNKTHKTIANLDKLSHPTRYTFSQIRSLKTPSHIMGSRGCRGNCSFCSIACYQKFSSDKRWRGRSPKSIVEELIEISNKGETMVKFVDDNFFGDKLEKNREFEIARLLRKSKINMKFRISLRIDDVREDVIKELKQVGLFAVSLGVESFVERKLIDFAKGIRLNQIHNSLEILKKYKIYVQMGHIMFDPFVTLDEIKQEIFYLKKYKWTITKGICTKLFAADGTLITEKIKNKIGFVGKEGANNIYQIQQPQADNFYHGLRIWAKSLNSLYEQVIDPISAPKNVDESTLRKFHTLCINLKDLDLQVSEILLEESNNRQETEAVSRQLLARFDTQIKQIQEMADNLYNSSNLTVNKYANERI